jgi:cytochrome b561
MALRNTGERYGDVAIFLHWWVAATVIGLFALGLWMVELDYYDPWYRRGPDLHKGIGILLFGVMLVRLFWRLVNEVPKPDESLSRWERKAAHVAHWLLYALPFLIMGSGYLISTADGRAVDVFGWFAVPALISGLPGQADIAGDIHLALASGLIVLAGVHMLAALKHHFIDHDRTLRKMLGIIRGHNA